MLYHRVTLNFTKAQRSQHLSINIFAYIIYACVWLRYLKRYILGQLISAVFFLLFLIAFGILHYLFNLFSKLLNIVKLRI